jgi:uncharacterized protein with PCYCGC motif
MSDLQTPNRSRIMLRAGALICLLAFLVVEWNYPKHSGYEVAPAGPGSASEKTPPYSSTAPTGTLGPTLAADEFDDPDARQAYQVAAKIEPLLYQLPCYCHCDRTDGHKNLLACFRSYHGANCLTCQREAVFAYDQFQNGKAAPEIRRSIIHGDWRDSHQ